MNYHETYLIILILSSVLYQCPVLFFFTNLRNIIKYVFCNMITLIDSYMFKEEQSGNGDSEFSSNFVLFK
jgi:hypothetical protein